jgi:hypothetical protein
VARYIDERDAATLTVQTVKEHKARLVLDSTRPRPPYDVPLTIVLDAGPVTSARASRSRHSLPVEVRGSEVLISASPGPETIDVSWR